MAKVDDKFVSGRIENIKSDMITITEDKLRNKLNYHIPRVQYYNDWKGALTTLISLIATIYACTFAARCGLSADTWKALFIIGIILSSIFFITSVYRRFHASDIDMIVDDIKNTDESQTQQKATILRLYGLIFRKWKVSFTETVKLEENKNEILQG